MRQLKKLIILVAILGLSCSSTDKQFENILKSPGEFHGQQIEISGVFHNRFEDVAVYLTTDSKTDKAIWINFSKMFELLNTFDELDGHRIKVTGTFNKKDKGHLGQYAASLDEAKIITE